ncbi:flagellar protein FliT [Kushneria aurantia]|uniref:Flagellar protein FliT n=1 Tax=Kushneria aurantia TaxID=504092 RepID=A0ABV6G134_9GAMM|nr:flagellar protein FliT [Kushneria aurantia]
MEETHSGIIQRYERTLALSEQMLEQAAAQQWETLIAHENRYLREIENLRTLDSRAALDSDRQDYKKELLEKLVDNDRRLGELLQGRLGELSELIEEGRNRQRIVGAYGVGSESPGNRQS